MSEFNSDKEPLIGFAQPRKTSSKDLLLNGDSPKIYDEKSPALPAPGFPKHSRGYGTLIEPPVVHQKLVYTWENIDIFGEAAQPSVSCLSVLKSCAPCNRAPVLRKHLLKNVYGLARGGEVTAILGSSGAGKTTLLNALAYRSPTGIQISSSAIRAINGIPVTANELRARCAYVQQDDLFIGSLTPTEHLIFQAMLRIPKSVPYKQKLDRVNEVINELSLVKCRNTIIGVPGRMKGLSGGERKRLSFASEALTDPPLLLCDEPTSGLDSFIAQNVIQVLRNLAGKGKTVILTIHQPSSELFHLFDKLVFMAEGRTAFFGTPDEAKGFFSGAGFDCPINYNPADFYIQILAIDPNDEQESRNQIQRICDSFSTDKLSDQILENIQAMKKENRDIDSVAKGVARYRSDWFTQLRAIMWRSWISTIKEPLLIKVRLIQTVMIAILIGLIFFKQEMNQEGVMNINGALFLFLTNMTFQNVFSVMNVFCGELPVFLRESRSQLYRPDTFFLGKTLAELPLFLLVPFLFTSITYPMIGLLPGVDHFLVAVAIVTLIANTATSFGYMISCASRTTSMALALGPPIIIPFLLFGGFFLNAASVPFYFEWLSYLSWFRYGNEALLINQWASVGEGMIECTRSNQTCPSSGHVILETLNFSEVNLIRDIFALVGLIIAFRLLAFLALYVRSRSKE